MASSRVPDRLSEALAYVGLGWHVFPLNGKRPATPHGWKNATTDPHAIVGWFAGTSLNVGIATGDSRLIVVDLDGPEAIGWWQEQDAPATAMVRTGRGEHHYFTGTARSTSGTLAPGVDTRGLGGYVVAPPSQHPDGRTIYTWERPRDGVLEAPGWLLEALKPRRVARPHDWGDLAPAGILSVLWAYVAHAPAGCRNERLNVAAYRCRGWVPPAQAVPALLNAAGAAGLPWEESVRTAASGLGLGVDDVLAALRVEDPR